MQKRGEGGEDVIDLPFPMKKKKRGEEGREIYHGSDKLPFVIHDEIRYSVSDAYIYIYVTSLVHTIAFPFFHFFFPLFSIPRMNVRKIIGTRSVNEIINEMKEESCSIYIYIYLFNFILFTIPFNQPIHSLPLL